jgi:hypothetical protein
MVTHPGTLYFTKTLYMHDNIYIYRYIFSHFDVKLFSESFFYYINYNFPIFFIVDI